MDELRLCGLNCCFTLLPLLSEMVAGRGFLARDSGRHVREASWSTE